MIGEPTWRAGLADWVGALAPHPDGAAVACGSLGGDSVVLDVASGEVLTKLPAHPMGMLQLAWQPGGERLAITGQDGIVRVVDRAGTELAATDVGGWAEAAVWAPDGRWLAVGAGRSVHLFLAARRRRRGHRSSRRHRRTPATTGGGIMAESPPPGPTTPDWAEHFSTKWLAAIDAVEAQLGAVDPALLTHASIAHGESVLDVGCARGATTATAARRRLPASGPTGVSP